MMKVIAALSVSSVIAIGTAIPAVADNPTCPSCNQGGGSIGDGFVMKAYRCPNEPGKMLSVYESLRGTAPDLSSLCGDDEITDDIEIDLPDSGDE